MVPPALDDEYDERPDDEEELPDDGLLYDEEDDDDDGTLYARCVASCRRWYSRFCACRS